MQSQSSLSVPSKPELPAEVPADLRLLAVLDHWHAARGPNLMPARRDITMRGLGRCLPFLIIHEVQENDVVIRLSGTGMRRYFGSEATGKSVRCYTPEDLWPTRLRRFQIAANHPCGFWAVVPASLEQISVVPVGMLYLPIRYPERPGITGILSVTVDIGMDKEVGRVRSDVALVDHSRVLAPFSIGAGAPAAF